MRTNNMLPEHLQADYEIVGHWPANFEVANLEVKQICWAKMTRTFAERLIAEGFSGIKRKVTSVSAPEPAAEDIQPAATDPEEVATEQAEQTADTHGNTGKAKVEKTPNRQKK